MRKSDNTFATDSFVLASYLLAESCSLLMVDKTNSQRMSFIFEESEKRKQLTSNFLAYKASVEPNRFYSASKNIKQLIYQNK